MPSFNIGDRVLYTGILPCGRVTDEPAVVRDINVEGNVGLEFTRNIGGHTLNQTDRSRSCARGFGWYAEPATCRLATPSEPVVGSRVLVNGHVSGVGEVFGHGTIVVISPEEEREPFGVEFDEVANLGHRLTFNGEDHCDFDRGLWVSRDVITVIQDEPVAQEAPAKSSLYEELRSCRVNEEGEIPADILGGSYRDLAVYLLENPGGGGATAQEIQSLLDLLDTIRESRKLQGGITKPFLDRLLHVEF